MMQQCCHLPDLSTIGRHLGRCHSPFVVFHIIRYATNRDGLGCGVITKFRLKIGFNFKWHLRNWHVESNNRLIKAPLHGTHLHYDGYRLSSRWARHSAEINGNHCIVMSKSWPSKLCWKWPAKLKRTAVLRKKAKSHWATRMLVMIMKSGHKSLEWRFRENLFIQAVSSPPLRNVAEKREKARSGSAGCTKVNNGPLKCPRAI